MLIGFMVPMVCFVGTPLPNVRAAAAPQWFPGEGEVCNYSLTWALGCADGNTWIDNKFNVYMKNGHQWIAPISYSEWFSTPYTEVINNTSIIFRFTYRKVSENQLNRTVAIVAGDTVFSPPNASFAFVVDDSGTWSTSHALFDAREDSVAVNDFFNQPKLFVDYFNTALLPLETFPAPRFALGYSTYSSTYMAPACIQTKTGPNIISTWAYVGSYLQNGTYIADATGRVLSYNFFDNNLAGYPDYRAFRLTFTNTNPPVEVEVVPPINLSLETILVLIVSIVALVLSTYALIRANNISRSGATPAKEKAGRK